MFVRLRPLIAAVPLFVAACSIDNLSHHSSAVQWDPDRTIGQHFDYVQDGSRASQATGMLEVPILGDGVQQTVPRRRAHPFHRCTTCEVRAA